MKLDFLPITKLMAILDADASVPKSIFTKTLKLYSLPFSPEVIANPLGDMPPKNKGAFAKWAVAERKKILKGFRVFSMGQGYFSMNDSHRNVIQLEGDGSIRMYSVKFHTVTMFQSWPSDIEALAVMMELGGVDVGFNEVIRCRFFHGVAIQKSNLILPEHYAKS